MKEDYALFLLKREQQILSRDMQLQGPGVGVFHDERVDWFKSLGNAIDKIKSGK